MSLESELLRNQNGEMTKLMKASILAVNLLKEVEGWSSTAYHDGAGKMTIGWGHMIREDEGWLKHTTISEDVGEALLTIDVDRANYTITETVKVQLTENQRAALVSLVYNIGDSAWRESTTLKMLNNKEYDKMPSRFYLWSKITDPKTKEKVTSKGLLNRRAKEVAVWEG